MKQDNDDIDPDDFMDSYTMIKPSSIEQSQVGQIGGSILAHLAKDKQHWLLPLNHPCWILFNFQCY